MSLVSQFGWHLDEWREGVLANGEGHVGGSAVVKLLKAL